jgi:hypothetical protein
MTTPYVPPEELLHLLAALADGDLTAEQECRLAAILRVDPQARAYYLDHMALLTSLQWEYAAAAAPGEPGAMAQRPARSPRRTRFVFWAAAGLAGLAAGLVLVLTLVWQRRPDPAPAAAERAEPTDDSVAVLLQAPGAVWQGSDRPLRPGASLPAGRLHLKSGLAYVQFYSGATVILEGPADVRLISPTEMYCTRGKLRAQVPPQAQGFRIGSPKLDLVDRGTEFGLRVDGRGQTEVHVFQGKVELYDAGSDRATGSRRDLTTGRGLRLDERGAARPIVPDPAAFLTVRELAARSEDEARRRHRAWLAASVRLRRDPRVLVYYTFQAGDAWNRTLSDQVHGRQPKWDGAIVGCQWVRGRWPGKQSLEFKRPGDRVRIYVPGEYASLTFMAWVRIDGLDNKYNGLLVTDKWGDGRIHWQIKQDEALSLTLLRRPGEHDQFYTPPVLGPAYLGQWTHLAAVYDAQAGKATHYVNGRAVSSHVIRYPCPLRIGSAAIGNWGAPAEGHPNPIRNLNGRMDEFLLFNQALGAQEIEDLYQAGKPTS